MPLFSEAYVYILASRRNGTLYTGSTTDLSRRVWEHKEKLTPGFTSDYNVATLVWYERYDRLIDARHREYKIKKWRRTWKLQLIEAMNPEWRDLYEELNATRILLLGPGLPSTPLRSVAGIRKEGSAYTRAPALRPATSQ